MTTFLDEFTAYLQAQRTPKALSAQDLSAAVAGLT